MKQRLKYFTLASLSIFLSFNHAQSGTDELVISAEDLCYNEFIVQEYTDGLRAYWGGVYSNYLTSHPDDDWYNPHNVITESTTLLAQIAALRGDETTLSEMIDILESPLHHRSTQFQLYQWLLDPNGEKSGQNFANAAGEENRMLEVLKLAHDQFGDTGLRDYTAVATIIKDGLKGVGGGIGNFEAAPYDLVYDTNYGNGGFVSVEIGLTDIEDILLLSTARNTSYGNSIYEFELLNNDGENVSLTSTARASSEENAGYSAQKAVDGDSSSRWSSLFSDPQWLWLRLNEPQMIQKMHINWEAASSKSYQVLALKSAVEQSGQSLVENILFDVALNTRFIRILGHLGNPGTGQHRISEIRIYSSVDDSFNLAQGKTVWVSDSSAQSSLLTDDNTDTFWSSDGATSQWALLDLDQTRLIKRVQIVWSGGPDALYAIQYQPAFEAHTEDGYLMRPQFVWKVDNGSEVPITNAAEVTDITLGNKNFLGYYYAWTWLGDNFYRYVLSNSIKVAAGAQNIDSTSPGYGLFHNFYNIRAHNYKSEYADNVSTTLSNCDIATRLMAFSKVMANQKAKNAGLRYLRFIKNKMKKDGVVWAGYDYDSGLPKWPWEDLATQAFVTKLFIQFGEFELAEKMLRERVLPKQHTDSADLYYGAIMEGLDETEAQSSKYQDAGAFSMLESLIALNLWTQTPKGAWTSHYPESWTSVASVSGGDGAEDIITFSPQNARYVRIACKGKVNPDWGYSLYSFAVYRSSTSTTDYAANKTGSVSSAQLDNDHYLPMWQAFDKDDTTRWGSKSGNSENNEWIYVDLGSVRKIGKVRLLWENAYATDYEIQIAMPSTA